MGGAADAMNSARTSDIVQNRTARRSHWGKADQDPRDEERSALISELVLSLEEAISRERALGQNFENYQPVQRTGR
jgi:hypothetical protein